MFKQEKKPTPQPRQKRAISNKNSAQTGRIKTENQSSPKKDVPRTEIVDQSDSNNLKDVFIQKAEYEIKDLQIKIKKSVQQSSQALKRKIELEDNQKEWKNNQKKWKNKLQKEIFQEYKEQKKKLEQWIQECDEKIYSLKCKRYSLEMELKQQKDLKIKRGQKKQEIDDTKIKILEEIIQKTSYLIAGKEIQRMKYQEIYDKCKAALFDALKKDEKIYNFINFGQTEIEQLLSSKNESPYQQDIQRQNKQIQNHLNTQKELKTKIAKLQKEIDFHKRIIKGLYPTRIISNIQFE